jgi:hypothetical protein
LQWHDLLREIVLDERMTDESARSEIARREWMMGKIQEKVGKALVSTMALGRWLTKHLRENRHGAKRQYPKPLTV